MRLRHFWILWFLLTTTAAFAQQVEVEEFKFPASKNFVKIPFKLVHNLVVIPVNINNSKPLNFVVDTGVETSLLTQLGKFDSITLNNVRPLSLRGLGKGEGIKAMNSSGNRIHFSGIEAKGQQMLVLMENIFSLSTRLGVEIHGIIGYSLFKNFVVEIDYQNRVLTLFKPGTYPKKRLKKASRVPIFIEDAKPYVKAVITSEDGIKHPIRLVIDSGLSTTMLLYLPSIAALKIPQPNIEAYLGRGLNGEIHGRIGRVESLQLGSFLLKRPPASFPDSISIQHALNLKNRNGNLGADILQRFKVVMDYQNGQMFLTQNYKYGSPFYFNLSGLEIVTPIPGLNYYTVSDVLPNSASSKAGLIKGDALLTIDGVNCATKSLEEILSLFQSKPGRKLKLQVKRDSATIKTTLYLSDVI
ncbi:PDZ domain-containing protein [Nibribacter ruber]|uniref:PDZ domain-containing protein n=1 Tax=Nibribacter ruber TaxID=2698458 RepID=A0A6P1P0Z3_9BACT|nr:aspartyl protease family protein [Nibribacter ruber]QHL87123.1 PDZ domain-containing protein [Nibribacter ruber]